MAAYQTMSTTAAIIRQPGPGSGLEIVNIGQWPVYISNNSGVTSTTGLPLTPGSKARLSLPYNVPGSDAYYGVCATGQSTILALHTHCS